MTLTQNAGLYCHRGQWVASSMGRKYHDEEWLREKYVDEGMSLREIAGECGVTYEPIRQWMDKFGIDRRHSYDVTVEDERYKDEEWLYKRYWEDPKTASDIADMCNVSTATISYWLQKFNIETRAKAAATREEYNKLNNKDWLSEKYKDELMSAYQIAKSLNVSESKIYSKLEEFDIDRRGIETNRIPHAKELVSDEEWLRQKHVSERKSGPEIADMLDISDATVYHYLDKFGIGHPEPLKPLEYYGPNWQERRQEVISKYDGKCQGCGVLGDDLDRALSVHHIRPFREFVDEDGYVNYNEANEMKNLVPLCDSCHAKWEGLQLKPELADRGGV